MSKLIANQISPRSGNDLTLNGNVTIGGTLTYEDVTNIDSVGLITARSGIKIPDNQKLFAGTGDDLQLFHTGTDSYVDTTTGDLRLRTTGSADDIYVQSKDDVFILVNESETAAKFVGDGAVELNYNDVKKFETTASGVIVTGVVTATSFSGDGSQLSGIAAGITTTASTPSANSVVTLDLSSAQHHQLTLTAGITTITCSGGSFGESHSVVLIQPSSGIATVGLSSYFQFPSGSLPSFTEGNGSTDLISFVVKTVGTGAGHTELLASVGLNYQ